MHLVIGSSSQLAQYFPQDYVKVSSRLTDLSFLQKTHWKSVYLTFAEQRIYENNIDYITPNYLFSLNIINNLLQNSDKIVCYTSCELWDNVSSYISIDTPPNFNLLNNEYCLSKLLLWNKILELRKINSLYNKVIFIHPFYFNSTYRSQYFLFGKIFDSIINEKRIQVNNLDFYRDMVHTSFVVKKSIEATQDSMVGSGKLFHIRSFVQDLYHMNDLDYYSLVQEHVEIPSKNKLIMAKVDWEYSYQDLLLETQNDILKKR